MNPGVATGVAAHAALKGGGAGAKLAIWLVDDNDNYRQILSQLLNLQPGMECARDFPSATAVLAALAREAAPDVILLDFEMPRMTGLEAIPAIRQIAPKTKVMMLTTFFCAQRKKQVLAAGAAGFLLKQNSSAEIVAAIQAGRGCGLRHSTSSQR